MKVVLLLAVLGLSTTSAQHTKTVVRNITAETVPFDITKYDNTQSCGSIISDRIGGQCTTWEALAALGNSSNNNFGGWIIAGTKLNGSRDSVSINGAPAGFVPDLYHTYTAVIGGVLSSRRVKTTINVDRMNCLNPECTWVGDSRYVVDACFSNITTKGFSTDKGLDCQKQQWVFNKIRGTNLAVGRQLAIDSNATRSIVQTGGIKSVDVSRNVRVQSLVGKNSVFFEVHHIRYYKDDNRTSYKTQADFRPKEDPQKSIKDSTMHAILRNIYSGLSAPVIRSIETDGSCRLFVVNSNNCNAGRVSTNVKDTCKYNASAPVESLLISRYYIDKIITGELFELNQGNFLTEKTLNASIIKLSSPEIIGYNTSMIYRLGYIPFVALEQGLPQMENATELVDLAVEYTVACFESKNISSKTCTDFNTGSAGLLYPFKIIELSNDLWLEVSMSNFFNFFEPTNIISVRNINWNGIFDFLNRQNLCIDVIDESLKEIDRWHNAMETLVHPLKPNSLQGFLVEIEPGIIGDPCTNSDNADLRQDTQYLADLVSQVSNSALQTVSPTLTTTSAIVSFILVVLSFLALILTIESKKTHNIAVVVTAMALLASVGILVGDNVNTLKQNNLFLNSAIIVEKVKNGNCDTSSPLYVSAITQSYVESSAANIILWVAVGLMGACVAVAFIYLTVTHFRKNKPVP